MQLYDDDTAYNIVDSVKNINCMCNWSSVTVLRVTVTTVTEAHTDSTYVCKSPYLYPGMNVERYLIQIHKGVTGGEPGTLMTPIYFFSTSICYYSQNSVGQFMYDSLLNFTIKNVKLYMID